MVSGKQPKRGPGARTIELEWQDPPVEVPTYVVAWVDVLEELRQKPDNWARIATFSSTSGARTAEKKLAEALPKLEFGTFEFTSRRSAEGSELYAKAIDS